MMSIDWRSESIWF